MSKTQIAKLQAQPKALPPGSPAVKARVLLSEPNPNYRSRSQE